MAHRVVGRLGASVLRSSRVAGRPARWQHRGLASVSVAEKLGILTTTKVDPSKDVPGAEEPDDDQFVSLVPDTCCGTVQMHARQLVLLTPQSYSAWPSRPESTKGSLAWRYSQMLRAAVKRVRAQQQAETAEPEAAGPESPEGSSSKAGACGIGPRADEDDGADEEDELAPGRDRTEDSASATSSTAAASSEVNPLHVKFLMADMRGAGEVDPLFSFSDGKTAYTEQRRHAVMLFPDNLLVTDLSPSDVASVVTAAQAEPGQAEPRLRELFESLGSAARVHRLPGLHFLVCAHARRDKRCGENGVTVISWLRKWRTQRLADVSTAAFRWLGRRKREVAATDASSPPPLQPEPMPSPTGPPTPASAAYGVPSREVIHVWPVSHVGLHRMAANVLVNPPGDWFAHMHDEGDARALFDHAIGLGLATVAPDQDAWHSLRRASRAELDALGLRGVAWDARLPSDDSAAGSTTERDPYTSTPVARMIKPIAHWWRGRMGMSKQEQQRVFLEISPNADLDHANLSAKLMGGVDRH